MRKWLSLLSALMFAGVLAGQAQAGPITSASLTVSLAGGTPTFVASGATGTATSNTTASLGGGTAFAGTQTITLTGTTATKSPVDVIQVVIASNAAGNFTGATPNVVGGAATFTGSANLFATTAAFPASPFLVIPVIIGKTTANTIMGSGLSFSTFGAPWTAGVATITGVAITTTTPNGTVMNVMTTAMVTGNNGLTPGGSGMLTLVSPGKVYVSTGNKLPVIGTLVLNYVPEPGTLLLLGSGALGLAVLGRRRTS
jgi:hypothetical protein